MRFVAFLSALALTPAVWGADLTTVQSNNHFGFKLMRMALKNEPKLKNTLISPISAHYALSMALNGTSSSTKGQFLEALSYEQSYQLDSINAQNAEALNLLTTKPQGSPDGDEPRLSIQNSAWTNNYGGGRDAYNFSPQFKETLKNFYKVQDVGALNFKDKASADVINNWTKNATFGMIPKIIDPNTLSQLVWVLLNTTYLEGRWESPFNPAFSGPFTLADNTKILVPTISRTTRGRFLVNDEVQVAELEIAKSKLKAYVVLPQKSEDFLNLQTKDNGIWSYYYWQSILGGLTSTFGTLNMPKFSFEYGVTLLKDMPITKDLGLNFLFQDTADFSKLDAVDSQRSKVGIIKQNTKIEWSETGVKAAAATLVGGVGRSMPPRPTVKMIVDRPFFFAIYDEATNAFLFIGQVVDPR